MLAKITLGTATPRDLLALGRSLAKLPSLGEIISRLETPLLNKQEFDSLEETRDKILSAIAEEPPALLSDGGTIRDGFHSELDQLRDISRNSRQYIAAIETRERSQTGIQSLKVRFNNVFGYYIEISKSQSDIRSGLLRTQANPGECRTFYHTRTERTRIESTGRRGQNPRARAGDLSGRAIIRCFAGRPNQSRRSHPR